MSEMRESHIAIIGDGVGALITLGVLRYAGLRGDTITIYGDSPYPFHNLARYATAVRQDTMRSEGDGHLRPRNFPGLTLADAWRRGSPVPLIAALVNVYRPALDAVIAHAERVARRYQFEDRRVATRIGCVRRSSEQTYDLYDTESNVIGQAQHVVLALGHSALRWPQAVETLRHHPRIAHGYESPQFNADERVVIVGGGIAAIHLWLAALAAGAEVIALHRLPLRHQALNAPRCAFSAVGIDAYRQLSENERKEWLRNDRGSSYPWRLRWEWQLMRGKRSGRFRTHQAGLSRVIAGANAADPLTIELDDRTSVKAERLICATGFSPDARLHPLARQMIDEYELKTIDGLLQIEDDFTLSPLSRPDSICAAIGSLARWALPVADTFVGMKYAARRLAPMLLNG